MVDGLTQTLGQLGAVVAPAERNRLLASLNATFQQLPSVLTKLGAVFPITKSVTDCLSTHVKPILNRVVPDGALTTRQPVWQEFVHFLGGLASSGQNFDANGHWIRLGSGVGTNTISLGNIPIVGQLLGTAPSGGSAIPGRQPTLGRRPAALGLSAGRALHEPGGSQPGLPRDGRRHGSVDEPRAWAPGRSVSAADRRGPRGQACEPRMSRRMALQIKRYGRSFLILIALMIVGTASGFYILLQQRLPNPLQTFYSVDAAFPTAAAVVPGLGEPVNVAGVHVGQITGTSLHN